MPTVTAETSLSFDDAAALRTIIGRHRDLLVADTGNSSLAGSWRWAITAAHAVVVPVPLRRDAAVAAQRTLVAVGVVRPDVFARSVVVITDGPGDAPMVETDAFSALRVPVCRMPFEPLFASGERIALTQLRRETDLPSIDEGAITAQTETTLTQWEEAGPVGQAAATAVRDVVAAAPGIDQQARDWATAQPGGQQVLGAIDGALAQFPAGLPAGVASQMIQGAGALATV